MITKLKAIMELNSELQHLRNRCEKLNNLLITFPQAAPEGDQQLIRQAQNVAEVTQGMFKRLEAIIQMEINNIEKMETASQMRGWKMALINFSPYFDELEAAIAAFDDLEQHFDDYDDIGNNEEASDTCGSICDALKELDNLMKQVLVSRILVEDDGFSPLGNSGESDSFGGISKILEESFADILKVAEEEKHGISNFKEKRDTVLIVIEESDNLKRYKICPAKESCSGYIVIAMEQNGNAPCWDCKDCKKCLEKYLMDRHTDVMTEEERLNKFTNCLRQKEMEKAEKVAASTNKKEGCTCGCSCGCHSK